MIYFNFPEHIIEQYTYGDCWLLSNALNKLGGYDRIIAYTSEPTEATDFVWGHAANILQDKAVVDIKGIYSEASFKKKGYPYLYVQPTKIESDIHYNSRFGKPPDTQKALRWAKKIHEELQLLT